MSNKSHLIDNEHLETTQKNHSRETGQPTGSQSASSSKKEASGKFSGGRKEQIKELQLENSQLRQQVFELQNKTVRFSAELKNIRNRYDREMEKVLIYSNEKLIENILPLVDDFERAIQVSDKSEDWVAFKNGVEMIYGKLVKVLESQGVKPIKALGTRFDYNLHEAVLTGKKGGFEPGTVIEEVQKGYLYKDKVLRHAKVIVAE